MNLTVQTRTETGKGPNRQLREAGQNPGIIYGKGEPTMVQMRSDYALRFIKSLHGNKKQVEITVEVSGKEVKKDVIIQDYQMSPYGQRLLHIDFLEVDPTTILTLQVPVQPTDNCKAIKLGAVIQVVRPFIPVRCAVKDIPEFIEVDIEELTFAETVKINEVKFPEGVKPIIKGRNYTLITVAGRKGTE